MSLSIRGRLTAWYAAVLSGVLAVFAAGFYLTHARSRLASFDEELAAQRAAGPNRGDGDRGRAGAARGRPGGPGRHRAAGPVPGGLRRRRGARGRGVAGGRRGGGTASGLGEGAHATVRDAKRRGPPLSGAAPGSRAGFEVGAAESLPGGRVGSSAGLRRALGAAFLVSLALALAGWMVDRARGAPPAAGHGRGGAARHGQRARVPARRPRTPGRAGHAGGQLQRPADPPGCGAGAAAAVHGRCLARAAHAGVDRAHRPRGGPGPALALRGRVSRRPGGRGRPDAPACRGWSTTC